MTELSFLIELLLNHKLPKLTKDAIAMRIKDVEAAMNPNGTVVYTPSSPIPVPINSPQAASTLALMAKHGDIPNVEVQAPQKPETVAVIAHTPAAQAAMQSRQEAISAALSGKPEKGATKPRKW